MDFSGTSKVEVIATAIDGNHLVLETVPEKNEIRWPLNNLPRPLEIGSRLTLELQKNQTKPPGDISILHNPAPQNTSDDKDEIRRKLLEDLVN
jgi:hypothetical protein